MAGKVTGLFYGDSGQLVAELIGIAANIVYVGIVASVSFFVIGKLLGGHRPTAEVEVIGLDMDEMGVYGYSNEGRIG